MQTYWLLENGANLNTQDDKGLTALMMAVKNRQLDTVNLLLQYGADANIRNIYDISAFTLAANNQEILELLEQL